MHVFSGEIVCLVTDDDSSDEDEETTLLDMAASAYLVQLTGVKSRDDMTKDRGFSFTKVHSAHFISTFPVGCFVCVVFSSLSHSLS